ncbi:MAG: TolC family protein [Candidatus Omnitrophica bacterium]|jgi:outer membrane protein TolC|nr:TolC family protein [Candidatus Omnitrophota bacterium]
MSLRIYFCLIILFSIFIPSLFAQDSLSWQDCIREAKKNNPELIYAFEGVNQKEAAKGISASGLYPQVDASFNASTARTKTTNSSGLTTKATKDSYSYGLSATQLVFDGFKTVDNLKEAAENIKSARENYRFASSSVRLGLRSGFVGLLKAQELVTVIEEILKIRRDNLELITLRYYSGLEHRGALLTAEANLMQAQADLASAKRDMQFAQINLSRQMGRAEFKPFKVTGDFSVTENTDTPPDFQGILKKHPSVLEAQSQVNAASFNLRSTYSQFYPQVSATAGANRSGEHLPAKDKVWELGLGIDLPIFEGGLRSAQVAQAKALYNQAQANQRSVSDQAFVNLQQAWVNLLDALDTVNVKLKLLNASLERSKIAEAQYSTGFIGFNDWIIIQNDLVSAKKSYLQAQADALSSQASWVNAKGETLEYAQ